MLQRLYLFQLILSNIKCLNLFLDKLYLSQFNFYLPNFKSIDVVKSDFDQQIEKIEINTIFQKRKWYTLF